MTGLSLKKEAQAVTNTMTQQFCFLSLACILLYERDLLLDLWEERGAGCFCVKFIVDKSFGEHQQESNA